MHAKNPSALRKLENPLRATVNGWPWPVKTECSLQLQTITSWIYCAATLCMLVDFDHTNLRNSGCLSAFRKYLNAHGWAAAVSLFATSHP
eukprot:g73081.t1